jgi:hypothetical protein
MLGNYATALRARKKRREAEKAERRGTAILAAAGDRGYTIDLGELTLGK